MEPPRTSITKRITEIREQRMPKPRKVGRPKKQEDEASVIISMRITKAQLAQLRRAAEDAGHGNLSREINNRLRRSFVREQDEIRNPATRAICFLFAEVADELLYPEVRDSWHRSPFLFKAVKAAFTKVLA